MQITKWTSNVWNALLGRSSGGGWRSVESMLSSAYEYVYPSRAKKMYKECDTLADAVDRVLGALENYTVIDEKAAQTANAFTQAVGHNDVKLGAMDYLLTGQALFALIGNVKYAPVEILRIKCERMNVERFVNDEIRKVTLQNTVVDGIYAPDENDRLIRADGLVELVLIEAHVISPLTPISAKINILTASNNQNHALIKNGGRLSLLFSFNDEISEDEHEARQREIKNRFTGSGAGGVAVVQGGDLEVKEFGLSPKDMDWATLTERCENAIYGKFKIPLALVRNDASTFNNLTTAQAMLHEEASLPVYDRIVGELGQTIGRRLGEKPNLKADREKIDALVSKRLEQIKMRKDIGVETTNELRGMLAERKNIEGGDEILVAANVVRLSDVGGALL
jgi:phage portal protein BeeE